jgi:hypothetical protein
MEPNEGYIRAKRLLKERFGNEYLITESWVRKVTVGNSFKAADCERLFEYSDELNNCVVTLKAMGKLNEVNSQTNLLKITERLPVYLQNRWRKEARDIRVRRQAAPSIEDLAAFITRAAEEANDPVFGQIAELHTDTRIKIENRMQNRPVMRSGQRNFSIQASSAMKGHGNGNFATSCLMCGANHGLFQCDRFKDLKPEHRLKFTREKRLCDNCLRTGHKAAYCLKPTRCSVQGCGKKHTKFLHLLDRSDHPAPAATVNSIHVEQQSKDVNVQGHIPAAVTEVSCSLTGAGRARRIALPVVPVKVTSRGSNNTIVTCALLDSGSTNTFCSEELKNLLGVKGMREMISLTTLETEDKIDQAEVVELQVSSLNDQNVVILPHVYTRKHLPLSLHNVATIDDVSKWSHLNNIELVVRRL